MELVPLFGVERLSFVCEYLLGMSSREKISVKWAVIIGADVESSLV